MECNKDEAVRAKALAERKMLEKDFAAAKRLITKAQKLYAEVDNISQMLTVCDVHCAAETKAKNGEIDWYGILQVPSTADDTLIKRQYRKLALLLHPDKNQFAGAEEAFKLVGEANMTLTDRSKRSVYDMKLKASATYAAVRPSPYQQSKKTAPAFRPNTTPVNLQHMHQQQQQQSSSSAGSQTFWTICSSCGMRYQYYRSILKKALRCQNCLKPFIAHDLNEQAVPSGVNQQSAAAWKNAGAPQYFAGSQTNATAHQAWNSATPGVHANFGSRNGNRASVAGGPKDKAKFAQTSKASKTAGLKRSRRSMIESSDSETTTDSEEETTDVRHTANNAGPSQHARRSSRQKQEVKYAEESENEDINDDANDDDDDAIVNSNLRRLKKGGILHSDDQSNETKLKEDATGHNGPINGVQYEKHEVFHSVGNNGLGLNSDNASDEVKIDCVDSEFFDFNQLRDVNQFRPNQIWAVYDDLSCMPRFYARITKVKTAPKFVLQFVWLEFDPRSKTEIAWCGGDLPVACGHFKHGRSETARETNMFSQTISCEKSKTRNSYEIYPKKGEVWALFRGWDIRWSSDADNHKNYEYDVVQVVSDFTTSTSIIVMPLVKVNGFVSLFVQSKEAAPHLIPRDGTLRFSHCVPHHVMSGTEREGIPEGALELDPAALPHNLERAFASVVPESSSVKGQKFDVKYVGSSSGNNAGKGSVGVGERQHMNAGSFTKIPEEDNREDNTLSAVEDTDGDEEPDDIILQVEVDCVSPEFYDFAEIRLLQKFKPGQIWALYSDRDKFPNYYALVRNVDIKNNKVQVRFLDAHPQGEEEKRLVQEDLTVACGTFRVSIVLGVMTYTGTESFSHTVRSRPTGRRNEYEISPRVHEIWAVFKNWRTGWTSQDFSKCEYELVEILGQTDSSIQVQLLRKVDGYTAVFRKAEAVKTIRKEEYLKFSHMIPHFRLTNEDGGKLQGCLELDPHSVPEEFLPGDLI